MPLTEAPIVHLAMIHQKILNSAILVAYYGFHIGQWLAFTGYLSIDPVAMISTSQNVIYCLPFHLFTL